MWVSSDDKCSGLLPSLSYFSCPSTHVNRRRIHQFFDVIYFTWFHYHYHLADITLSLRLLVYSCDLYVLFFLSLFLLLSRVLRFICMGSLYVVILLLIYLHMIVCGREKWFWKSRVYINGISKDTDEKNRFYFLNNISRIFSNWI